MDPIKVDFSKKGGSAGNSEIVIPPERAVLKIIISLVLTVIFAGAAFYFMLPALNFKSYDLYLYIGLVAASFVVFNGLLNNVLAKPEYVPYVKKHARVSMVIILALLVVVSIGYVVSSQFFRASDYASIISVRTDGNFSEEIPEQDAASFSSIPRLDEDSAKQIASRALGDRKSVV